MCTRNIFNDVCVCASGIKWKQKNGYKSSYEAQSICGVVLFNMPPFFHHVTLKKMAVKVLDVIIIYVSSFKAF